MSGKARQTAVAYNAIHVVFLTDMIESMLIFNMSILNFPAADIFTISPYTLAARSIRMALKLPLSFSRAGSIVFVPGSKKINMRTLRSCCCCPPAVFKATPVV